MKKTGVFIVLGIIFLVALVIGSLIKNYLSKTEIPTHTDHGNYITTITQNNIVVFAENNENDIIKNNIVVTPSGTNIAKINSLSWKYTVENLNFENNKFTWEEINEPDFICYQINYFQNGTNIEIQTTEAVFDVSNLNFKGEILIQPIIKNRNTQAISKFIDTTELET